MDPNERTPVVERQRWSARLPTSRLPTHTGSEGRGDETNVWDRRCWRVKRGRSQPWTKALWAEARRRLVNWSGPGHERIGGWVQNLNLPSLSLGEERPRLHPSRLEPWQRAPWDTRPQLSGQLQALPRDPDMRLNNRAHRNTPTLLSPLKTHFHLNTTLSWKVAEVKHITFFL